MEGVCRAMEMLERLTTTLTKTCRETNLYIQYESSVSKRGCYRIG